MKHELPPRSWREDFEEKMAMVHSLDQSLKEKALIMEREFDIFTLSQQHEEWKDRFSQKLARYEMDMNEKMSSFPELHGKIKANEDILKKHRIVLKKIYEEKYGKEYVSSRKPEPESNYQQKAERYTNEGWLHDAQPPHSKRYYRLSPATTIRSARLYGFASDEDQAPVTVIELPRNSSVTINHSVEHHAQVLYFVKSI